jgi:hypothetical protein
MLKQISIFLPNQPGVLAKFTKILMDKQINMRAITVAETADYGILRIVVDKTDKAVEILKNENYLLSLTDVIAVNIPDKPGALHDIAEFLGNNNVNIEYIYSSTFLKGEAIVVLRVDDNEKAMKTFKDKGVKLVESKDLY